MIFRHFRIQVVIRVILLCCTIILGLFFCFRISFPASALVCLILIGYQVINLIRYVERTRRDLAQFFNSVTYDDFIDKSPVHGSSDRDELRNAFARVVNDFQQVRAQREEQYHYVQTIVQHLSIGIITYDKSDNIELINSAASRLFRLQQLKNVHDLERFGAHVKEALLEIGPGERRIVAVSVGEEKLQLAIDATLFRRGSGQYTLVSIQDIHNELEEKEMEAWQKIMRVLTHEIRNSITPIASLASTAEELLRDEKPTEGTAGVAEDVYLAVETIRNRSKGLLKFVESFRSVYQIPKPSFEIISVRELFAHLQVFFRPRFEEHHIRASFRTDPETLELTADPQLIEQVMINLILNAVAAVRDTERAVIEVSANLDNRGCVTISIADNGPGISDEVQEKIFIPFFTTKKEGSGIGLTLSRQIMRLHQGVIQMHSKPHERTVFTLRF